MEPEKSRRVSPSWAERPLSRRRLLGAGSVMGLGAAGGALLGRAFGGGDPRRLVDRSIQLAANTSGSCDLSDIEHVVILIQENRSFDSYFGTYGGVNGFTQAEQTFYGTATEPVVYQPFNKTTYSALAATAGNPEGYLAPFHFVTNDTSKPGQCTNDITHNWKPQHLSWNGGAMDGFVSEHLSYDGEGIGVNTMGYYEREDLPFYYALADAYTICDAYHCSVLGPTYPNRLYSLSATLDPDGDNGGPVVETYVEHLPEHVGTLTWTTFPEVLLEAGVPWKIYETPDANADNVLMFFKAYTDPAYQPEAFPELSLRTFGNLWPAAFQADVSAGTLPPVSWVLAPVAQSEHPASPPAYGEAFTSQLLQILLSNPAVWEKTALFVTYDENGGFFDHVLPPTAPPGTPHEYLTGSLDTTTTQADGIAGPIGLGFRVPMLVVSPFSTGGLVDSTVYDHTSLLKFLARRFLGDRSRSAIPNLSEWRYKTVGDMTPAFDFAASPDYAPPDKAIALTPSLANTTTLQECAVNGVAGTAEEGQTYPVPQNSLPTQESGSRKKPSGLAASGSGSANPNASCPAAASEPISVPPAISSSLP